MGIWNREQQVNPAQIAQIQAQIDADPVVQQYRAGYGSPSDPWHRGQGGKVTNPDQLREYIASKYQLPDGYNVSQDGSVVYGNETGWLRKVAMSTLPIAGASAAGALAGGSTPAASAAGTLGPATPIPGVLEAASQGATLGTATAGGAGAGLLAAGNNAINGATPLGGVQTKDLASRASEWFTDPRNLVGLASVVPALIAAGKGSGGASGQTQDALNNANRMNAITEARMRRVDPLHQAVTQLAFGRLPVSSRNGVNLTNVPLPE